MIALVLLVSDLSLNVLSQIFIALGSTYSSYIPETLKLPLPPPPPPAVHRGHAMGTAKENEGNPPACDGQPQPCVGLDAQASSPTMPEPPFTAPGTSVLPMPSFPEFTPTQIPGTDTQVPTPIKPPDSPDAGTLHLFMARGQARCSGQ